MFPLMRHVLSKQSVISSELKERKEKGQKCLEDLKTQLGKVLIQSQENNHNDIKDIHLSEDKATSEISTQ